MVALVEKGNTVYLLKLEYVAMSVLFSTLMTTNYYTGYKSMMLGSAAGLFLFSPFLPLPPLAERCVFLGRVISLWKLSSDTSTATSSL